MSNAVERVTWKYECSPSLTQSRKTLKHPMNVYKTLKTFWVKLVQDFRSKGCTYNTIKAWLENLPEIIQVYSADDI